MAGRSIVIGLVAQEGKIEIFVVGDDRSKRCGD